MRIYISWSGQKSRAVADALSKFIPVILQRARVYVGGGQIEAGVEWRPQLMDAIRKADFGISCLTKDNINSPWLTFELGLMSGILEQTRFFPLLIDLSYADLVGPLASFQAARLDRSDMRRLLLRINRESLDPLPDEVFNESFEIFWPKFEQETLYKLDAPEVELKGAARDAAQLMVLRESLKEVRERLERLEKKLEGNR